jgi:hypothetical protein
MLCLKEEQINGLHGREAAARGGEVAGAGVLSVHTQGQERRWDEDSVTDTGERNHSQPSPLFSLLGPCSIM